MPLLSSARRIRSSCSISPANNPERVHQKECFTSPALTIDGLSRQAKCRYMQSSFTKTLSIGAFSKNKQWFFLPRNVTACGPPPVGSGSQGGEKISHCSRDALCSPAIRIVRRVGVKCAGDDLSDFSHGGGREDAAFSPE